MSSYLQDSIQSNRQKPLLLDTNLLLLLWMGRYDPEAIERHKRTAAFTKDDFVLLSWLVDQFKTIVVTPNILTEVCNLAAQGQATPNLFERLRKEILHISEEFVPSGQAVKRLEFDHLGLTDCVAVLLAERHFVVSVDYKLVNVIQQAGHDALNFNHIRTFA